MKNGIRFLLVLVLTLSSTYVALAQWVPTNGPYIGGGRFRCFATDGTNIYAGTQGGGVLISTDNGATWTQGGTVSPNGVIYSLAIIGTNIIVGTAGESQQIMA